MNKTKMFFIAAASLLGIGGAFATSARIDCTQDIQYRDQNGTLAQQGFRCSGDTPVCTYHKVGSTYTPCKFGVYTPPSPTVRK